MYLDISGSERIRLGDFQEFASLTALKANTNPSTIKVNEELAKKWLANGAQPTEVVGKLLKVAGIEK